jgi:beta-glucuronidase
MIKQILNGKWKCKPDVDNVGLTAEWFRPKLYDENDSELLNIEIPNSFNTLKGYEIYEGIFWHFFEFAIEEKNLSEISLFRLKFNGSNYNTMVWLNGKYLGEHNGGFTPFHFNVKKFNAEKTLLAVRVENIRKKNRIPAISFDWLNWGGIYRDVELLYMRKNRIKDVVIKTELESRKKSIIKISYEIIGELSLRWEIEDIALNKILFQGKISKISGLGGFNITFHNPELWSPNNPYLYYLKIFNQESDELIYESSFGIREIKVDGKYIFLNKKRVFLKGASLHEELMPFGRTIPYEERENDIKSMKSLGFNALRTAHYSHDEDLIEIADKEGMLILEEIPVYWACNFKSNDTFHTAAKMMRNLIKRDINHPSVIWWSVGNEIPIERPEVSKFIKRLMDWVRMHDDTRLVTYVSMKLFTDLTRRYADVATINFYFGWYVGSTRMISLMLDVMRTPTFNKPWIYTEFGAGAKYKFYDEWENQTKFSEEKQLHVLDYSIRTFNAKEYLAGWFIWIYRDFRSFLRQNEYQQGFNRKGIVSEKNEKKLIYHRIPKIINKRRKLLNTKLLGIFLWIVLYIPAYILTYLILDAGIIFGDTKTIEKKKLIDKERILNEYRNQ